MEKPSVLLFSFMSQYRVHIICHRFLLSLLFRLFLSFSHFWLLLLCCCYCCCSSYRFFFPRQTQCKLDKRIGIGNEANEGAEVKKLKKEIFFFYQTLHKYISEAAAQKRYNLSDDGYKL